MFQALTQLPRLILNIALLIIITVLLISLYIFSPALQIHSPPSPACFVPRETVQIAHPSPLTSGFQLNLANGNQEIES